MVDHNNPQSRVEEILIATIDGTEYNKLPQSRMEELLLELKEVIEEGSGGGGIRPIGVTTTPLYDGANTNPIQINGESYTAETGDMVTYQSTEFLFNVNEVWQELGDVSVVLAIIDDIFADIAPAFNAASTYAVDDYVIYNDQLYKCTTAHTGAWDAADFTATSLSYEIKNNKGTEYTAGDYVNITNDNVINVRVSKGTTLNTYRFTTQDSGYAMKIEKFVKGVKMSEVQYSNGQAAAIIDIDGVMEFGYKYAGYLWYYKLLTDSREHVTDQVVEWYYNDVVDISENFDVASDASKNIVLQEDLTNALAGKQDTLTFDNTPVANSNNPVKSGGVYSALAGKQNVLTAGKYINIDANNEIKVNPVVPNEAFTYRIQELTDDYVTVTKLVDGDVVFTETHDHTYFETPRIYDNAIKIDYYNAGTYRYELLIASDSHEAGYIQTWGWFIHVDYTETFSTVDHSGEKLITKSDMDTALADKQDVLLYGGVNPSSGTDGDMYVKLARDESTLIDMFGSPSVESTDDYEMSYTVDSSVMEDYYDYEAFGTGKGFGQNGRGAMTITYHFKNSKFKPANVSYCNNFNLSGGGYLESANFTIKASNDGTNWDTLYSTNTPCTRDTSVSADITANTYYSYFKFEMNSDGGYTGIRNIVMNGVSESYSNIDNIYFKNNGTWLKDKFVKKSDLNAKELRYTGTGTTPNTIDFGNDTPKRIIGIIPDPDEEFLLTNYEAVGEISWGMMLALSYWSTQSGGVPTTNNGGTNMVRMSFSGNTVTLNAGNAAQIANYSGQKYIVKYEV